MSKRRHAKDMAKRNRDRRSCRSSEFPLSDYRRIESTFDHTDCQDCHMLNYLGFRKGKCSEEEMEIVSECCLYTFINDPVGFLEEFADPMGAIVSMILLKDDVPYNIPLPNGGEISITYRPPCGPRAHARAHGGR